MHPILAFSLVELIILLAIIALFVILFGSQIVAAIASAKKATGGMTPIPKWTTAPPTIQSNTPTDFTFNLLFQKKDSKGLPVGSPQPTPNSPALFDLTMTKGNGHVISATVNGTAMPQPKDASPGSPATNIAGATDEYGNIIIEVELEQDAAAVLSAHESTNPKDGWTPVPTTFSAN